MHDLRLLNLSVASEYAMQKGCFEVLNNYHSVQKVQLRHKPITPSGQSGLAYNDHASEGWGL